MVRFSFALGVLALSGAVTALQRSPDGQQDTIDKERRDPVLADLYSIGFSQQGRQQLQR